LPNPLDMIAGPPKAKAAAPVEDELGAEDPHARKIRAVSRFRKAKTDEEAASALEDAINACLEYRDEGVEDFEETVEEY
jgi:hypothetical protein